LIAEFTVHLPGAVPAGIDAPMSQHPQSTIVNTLSLIETSRQGGIVGVEMPIEIVSQHRPAAVGVADKEGCFHVNGSSGQFHSPGTESLGNSRQAG
jgi:hypothetical protein